MNNAIRVPNTPLWAHYCGHEAYQLGRDTSDCPYQEGHELYDHWCQGWYDAMRKFSIIKPDFADNPGGPFVDWGDGVYSKFSVIVHGPPHYADTGEMDYSKRGLAIVCNDYSDYPCDDCNSDACADCGAMTTRADQATNINERVPDALKFLLDHCEPETIARLYHDVDQQGKGVLSDLLRDRIEQYVIDSLDAMDGFAAFHGELDILRGEVHRILPRIVLLPGQEVQVTGPRQSPDDPKDAGYRARQANEHLSANPYIDAWVRLAWAKGWLEADAKTATLLEQINERMSDLPEHERRKLFEGRFDSDNLWDTPKGLGMLAYRAGVQLTACPFTDVDEAEQWEDGWNQAQEDDDVGPADIPNDPESHSSAYRQGWWTAYAMNGNGAAHDPYPSDSKASIEFQAGFAAGNAARGRVFEEREIQKMEGPF